MTAESLEGTESKHDQAERKKQQLLQQRANLVRQQREEHEARVRANKETLALSVTIVVLQC